MRIGGLYALAGIWDRLPGSVKDPLRFGLGVASHEAARARARAFTLAGALPGLACPFLIVHSGLDTVCPVEESERIRKEAGGPPPLAGFPAANPVLGNNPPNARPPVAALNARRADP